MRTEHALTGIDPAVVHMAIKAPEHAPADLKRRMVMAAKKQEGTVREDMELKRRVRYADDYSSFFWRKHKLNIKSFRNIPIEVPILGAVKNYRYGQFRHDDPEKVWTMKEIMEDIAQKHEVSVNDIKSPRRCVQYVKARQEFFAAAKEKTGHSLPAIGKFCGNRDHTTVLHGIRKFHADQAKQQECAATILEGES